MIENPKLEPERGWEKLSLTSLNFGAGRSFVSGEPEGDRIRIKFYRERDREGRRWIARAKFWLGRGAEGPPNHAHGGSVAAILDEILGIAAWINGYPVLAARLSIDFLRPTPLFQELKASGEITAIDSRKIFLRGEVMDGKEQLLAKGEGIFIHISKRKFMEFNAEFLPQVQKLFPNITWADD